MTLEYIIICAGAYLLGAIPFGYVIYRLRYGKDIRAEGSGNIGATNVTRSAGPIAGVATLLLDFAKGYAAVLAAGWLTDNDPWVVAIAALAAVLGHVFPVYLRFRGGKGVATAVGVFLGLAPRPLLLAVILFVLLFAVFRYVSLGSILGAASMPLWMLLLGAPSRPVLGSAFVIALLVIARHYSNIQRLLAGTEHRLNFKRT
jgi:acyl phosphate:glycerol-3-phosphate acyltransferase